MKETKTKIRISRSLLLTMVFGALALGIFIGAGGAGIAGLFTPYQPDKPEETANREGMFKYIRAAVATKDPDGRRLNGELKPFRYKLNSLIKEKVAKGEAQSISVYFRDLNNGNWIGIGERETFSTKNLLKVPLMIAYFKWAESSPFVLRKSLLWGGSTDPEDEEFATTLEPGKTYSVNDLIFRMIARDDSGASRLLLANIPSERLDRVFRDLNVEYDPSKENDSLSLRAFASFYRVLFNASYLSEEMSEKALRYLSKSTFRDGIASGVPMNIEVASKFGRRTFVIRDNGDDKELYQLHEYAIIYHPRRPFLLGIMVRGTDVNSLTRCIRDVSRLVYGEIDQQS